jgi:HEAT repeat protein
VRSAYYLGCLKEPHAVDHLLRALADADDAQRREIAEAISQFGLDVIYERLDELMGSDSISIKIGVCWVLGATQDPRAVRLLSFFLRDTYPEVRSAAIGSLGRVHKPEVAALLLPCLKDINKKVRASVLNALTRIGQIESGIEVIAELLEDPDTFVRNRAAIAIGTLGRDAHIAEQLISRYSRETNDTCRLYLILGIALISATRSFQFTLPFFHQSESRKSLLALLQREEQNIQQLIHTNLKLQHIDEHHNPKPAIELFLSSLQQSQDPEERATAIDALEALATPEVLPYLIDSLYSDPDVELRKKTARSLHNLAKHHPESRPQIQDALLQTTKDPVPEVCDAALCALLDIADHKASPRLYELLDSKHPTTRKQAIQLLAQIHHSDISGLLHLIQTQEQLDRQRRAIFALRDVTDPKVISFLTLTLSHTDRGMRAAAVRALQGHIAQAPTLKLLLQAINDPASEVRYWSLNTIGSYRDPKLLEHIANSQHDPDVRVRIEFIHTLLRLEPQPPSAMLLAMLDDPIETVREQVFLSFLQICSSESLQLFCKYLRLTPLTFRQKILESIQEQNATKLPKRLLYTAPTPQHRLDALKTLETLDENGDVYYDSYLQALKDPSPIVRNHATRILLRSCKPLTDELKHQIMHDPDPNIPQLLRSK